MVTESTHIFTEFQSGITDRSKLVVPANCSPMPTGVGVGDWVASGWMGWLLAGRVDGLLAGWVGGLLACWVDGL